MILKDKVVVITGGAGLLGQEFTKAIVSNGGTAIVADIDNSQAKAVSKRIRHTMDTGGVDSVGMDITSVDSINGAIEYLDKKYGRVDALVNNAYPRNSSYGKPFFDVDYGDFVENVGMNLGGYFSTSRSFAKYFKKKGHGNIINISSIYGVIAPKFEIYNNTSMTTPVEYVAIKSGLIHLTKYMANYFKGMNIKVNAISPGGILDGQPGEFLDKYNEHCSGKGMLDKSDINGTLIYLLSDASKYVNGQNIIVDDGFCT